MKQFDQIVYANGKAKHLLLSECEFGLTRQVFIRCNITPLIGNSNTNGNYWMWCVQNPKLLPVRLMFAPKSKTMRSLKRKSPARKSMCVPHSALLSGKHPRPLLEQHSASHTRFVRHPVQSIGTRVAFVRLCADSNVFSAYLLLQPYKMFAASDSLRSADRWSLCWAR